VTNITNTTYEDPCEVLPASAVHMGLTTCYPTRKKKKVVIAFRSYACFILLM